MMSRRYGRRVPSLCLLGRDHQQYGAIDAQRVGDRAAAAISVGADPSSPSMVFKHDPEVANEDALVVAVHGRRTGLAVADAHYGPEASHVLIEALSRAWADALPATEDELLLEAAQLGSPALTESETALLIAVHDGDTGAGFGLSIGDASLVIVGPDHQASACNPRNHRYVSASGDDALPVPFRFQTAPGDLVLAFTDGIDECHYRNPDTSIQPHHIDAIVSAASGDPLHVVEQLSQLALDGVDGHPGGQDNIAVVALRV